MTNMMTTGLGLAAAAAMTAGMALAQDAPDWLGGELQQPLSETRIGITVLYPGSNAYQAMYAQAAEEYAEELGIQATVMDPQGDPAVQFDQIQDMISQNPDAIIVWPTSQNALIPAIRSASRAGIPVVTSNSPIGEAGRRYIVGHTGPDDCLQAQQAADMLADALDGEGNIVVVEGTPGYTVSILRGNCFLDRIADAYPGISVLDSQTAEWNRERAQTVMETFLTQYGDQINGVYAIDDGMGLGVISALQGGGTCHLPRQRRPCDLHFLSTTGNAFSRTCSLMGTCPLNKALDRMGVQVAADFSSPHATSDTAPAPSSRGPDPFPPSRQCFAGRRRDWRRSEPRPSGRRRVAIRSEQRTRLGACGPRVGSSRFLPSLTMPRYRLGAALRSGRRSPSRQAIAPDGRRVSHPRAAPLPRP
jgi:ribose transport system substrate-binding protein